MVQTPLGVVLVMLGAGILASGLLVLAISVPVGILLVAGGGAALLVGIIRTLVVQTPAMVPGVPVCYACGERLSWEGLSGRWWCPRCSQYR